jgi:D-3-phosphoglycerate dehydrogenase / 2-oxoglutarate reductase
MAPSISLLTTNISSMPASQPVSITSPVSPRVSASLSPTSTTFHDRFRNRREGGESSLRESRVLHPLDNDNLRLLLLENISQDAVAAFREQGFRVDHYTKAWSEDELVEKIGQYHAIGIRSKTHITERVIRAAPKVYPYVHTQSDRLFTHRYH